MTSAGRARTYLILGVLGTLLPLAQLLPWLAGHGLNLHQLWQKIAGSRISAFAWADVLVTVLTILAFIRFDAGRAGVRGIIWPVLAAFLVGASLALPLYLYLREVQVGAAQPEAALRS